jgi:hypothetical protein
LGSTYNPIRSQERQPKLRLFQPRLSPMPGVALVLHRDGGPLMELMPAQGTVNLGFISDVRIVYRIDVTEHALGFRFRLPSARDPHEFIADVELVCVVSRPVAIVERWLTDVRRVLEPGLEELLRDVSGRFAVDQRDAAERAFRRELRERASAGG